MRHHEFSHAEWAFVEPLPPRSGRDRGRLRHSSRGGRPPAFGQQVCKRRTVVERRFDRCEQRRGIATRYDRSAGSCRAAVTPASLPTRA
ncbi:hypothetical protein DKG34_23160 [Streptomyces sp. NWU49]|uniref:transposase n=1 Tax=Streptomyces sp. NWU49 TaxID=2201153 RepID=UPI000D67B250|nr:transposase [Streptomyces sp. NWU49]PWJ05197.1 hypothetical protein DKG34_23160 [Streptomyces sp. NWU49]